MGYPLHDTPFAVVERIAVASSIRLLPIYRTLRLTPVPHGCPTLQSHPVYPHITPVTTLVLTRLQRLDCRSYGHTAVGLPTTYRFHHGFPGLRGSAHAFTLAVPFVTGGSASTVAPVVRLVSPYPHRFPVTVGYPTPLRDARTRLRYVWFAWFTFITCPFDAFTLPFPSRVGAHLHTVYHARTVYAHYPDTTIWLDALHTTRTPHVHGLTIALHVYLDTPTHVATFRIGRDMPSHGLDNATLFFLPPLHSLPTHRTPTPGAC